MLLPEVALVFALALSAGKVISQVSVSCQNGFYQNSGECRSCSETCAINASSSLPVCRPSDGRCEFGCQSGYYGAMCDTICSKNCRNDQCDPITGSCTDGCILPVLTGSMCQQACSSGCLQRKCDQSGACILDGCQQGFWGTDCSQNCPSICLIPNNQADHVCNQTNAACLNGCVDNTYWGINCSKPCNSNCVNKECAFDTGSCLNGCIDGYEGSDCTKPVSVSCQNGFYQNSGECRSCSETCATNASSSLPVCRPSDGRCEFGCQSGYYGAMCDTICSKSCRNDQCDPITGACTDGCILPVLTGSMCQQACSSGCLQRKCDQSGACILDGCQQGFWGTDCSQNCPSICLIPNNQADHVCNQTNAACLNGCVDNTHWGINCSKACSSNCVNKKCAFDTGSCLNGCIDGYEGSDCTKPVKSDVNFVFDIKFGAPVAVALVILSIVICLICIKCRRQCLPKICCCSGYKSF